jgi:hypothetical protein
MFGRPRSLRRLRAKGGWDFTLHNCLQSNITPLVSSLLTRRLVLQAWGLAGQLAQLLGQNANGYKRPAVDPTLFP